MRRVLVPRLELALIALMCAGFLLVAQQWSFALYRAGLLLVMAAAILNVAVGNLPRQAGPLRAAGLTLGILGVVAFVFLLGILLVPYLARMGQ